MAILDLFAIPNINSDSKGAQGYSKRAMLRGAGTSLNLEEALEQGDAAWERDGEKDAHDSATTVGGNSFNHSIDICRLEECEELLIDHPSLRLSDLQPPTAESCTTTTTTPKLSSSPQGRGGREAPELRGMPQQPHETASSLHDNTTDETASTVDSDGSSTDKKRLDHGGSLMWGDMAIADIIDLKLLLANRQAAIDDLEQANCQLAAREKKIMTENTSLEARLHYSRERERGLRRELEQAEEGLGDLLAENAALKAQLARLAPER